MKNTEEIKKEIATLEKELSSLYDKQNKVSEQIRKLKLEAINIPFEGKYIKYVDTFDSTPIYMKVDWIRQDNSKASKMQPYSYTFKGFGFFGEFTGYDDATQFEWSYWFEFNITGDYDGIQEKISRIEEITKEDFNLAFEYSINEIKELHYQI